VLQVSQHWYTRKQSHSAPRHLISRQCCWRGSGKEVLYQSSTVHRWLLGIPKASGHKSLLGPSSLSGITSANCSRQSLCSTRLALVVGLEVSWSSQDSTLAQGCITPADCATRRVAGVMIYVDCRPGRSHRLSARYLPLETGTASRMPKALPSHDVPCANIDVEMARQLETHIRWGRQPGTSLLLACAFC
jgi:hypothetical protein